MNDNPLAAAERLYNTLNNGIKALLVRHRHPLEWCEGLRNERIDAECECSAAPLFIHIVPQSLREIDDRVDVRVLLKRQSHHEVKLEI